ncbi:coiled-coil domain-containing protein [Cryptosporangium minutisporangium]|uniref:coiled-coil domain-containing protein n=1 Tax=Cryptosporangium minutisporangium TaxID=113569 RepID=UPI0031EE4989
MTFVAPTARFRVVLALVAVLAALGLLFGGVPGPAVAAPSTAEDDEGGTASLRQKLDEAASGYNNARAKAQASERRRAALIQKIAAAEKRISALDREVQELSAAAYRGGLPDPATAMANSRSLPDMIGDVGLIESLSQRRQQTLDELRNSRKDLAAAQREVDEQLAKQRAEQRTMDKRRRDAEKALAAADVGGERTGGFSTDGDNTDQPAASSGGDRSSAEAPQATTPKKRKKTRRAAAAPRRSDGTWASQGCSQDDPTSGGCLTGRTLHALRQTKAAGFTRYVHCFRQASFGEHPKGRACDFAASRSGFGGAATGGDRTYGNRLAAWLVENADRLAVLYVIWYRQIWLPGSGWRAYQSGGDPSSAHTNHVHLSIQ